MKKIFTFFAAMALVAGVSAQTVDYELAGFIDEEQNFITELNLGLNDDLNPAVALMNNGPDVPANTDSIFIDISIMGTEIGSMYMLGSQMATLTAGQGVALSGQDPLFTAAEMNEAGIEGSFEMCYTIRIVGQATDPDASNNTACLTINRGTTDINEIAEGEVSVYPNPATTVLNVANAEGAQVSVFDMNGRVVASIENANANETINVANLAKGMYIVRIVDGQNVTTKKVSIAR